jgi:uncharacterized membrane protein YczE
MIETAITVYFDADFALFLSITATNKFSSFCFFLFSLLLVSLVLSEYLIVHLCTCADPGILMFLKTDALFSRNLLEPSSLLRHEAEQKFGGSLPKLRFGCRVGKIQ